MNVHPFSPAGRETALAEMGRGAVDLLVIGGGITGAGLARDAALRGLRVALVERNDFACGTSSRSSKLVHGGIRYLAYGDVALVRESARERKVLCHIAPHLVHPLPCVFPLFRGQSRVKYWAGFYLFDRLAGVTEAEAHRVLTAPEVRRVAPGLRGSLVAGFAYGEYITDDGRFTLENALSAALHGALVANYAPVVELKTAGERVVGAVVRDACSGREYPVAARVVVNATGPWAEATLQGAGLASPRHLLLSKGIHLLFPAARLPVQGGVMLSSPSGQEGFAIRRWDYVYVGTTDVPLRGGIDRPVADRAAVEDLLRLANDCFPEAHLTAADVVCTWAGLRPLIAKPGKAARDTSRHDEVWRIRPGLLTIAGGKLTTYRPMAARVMEQVGLELGADLGNNHRTAEVPLPGGDLGGREYEAFRAEMLSALVARGVARPAAERLTWLYGAWIPEMLGYGDDWLEPLATGFPALRAEVRLAVERGMAQTLVDFMDRRAGLLIFSPQHGLAAAAEAARLMAGGLGWDAAEQRRQVEAYRALASDHDVPVAEDAVPED